MKKKIVLCIAERGVFEMSGCPKSHEWDCGIAYRTAGDDD